MPTKTTPGQRLKARREGQGVSIKDLAPCVGVTRQTLYNFEADRHEPGVSLAIRLARHLGTTVNAIWEDPK